MSLYEMMEANSKNLLETDQTLVFIGRYLPGIEKQFHDSWG